MITLRSRGAAHAEEALFCPESGDALEEATWLKVVWATTAVAVLVHLVLYFFFDLRARLLIEVLMTEAMLFFVAYPALKLFQKSRQPDRQVLLEACSVHSDRFGRLLLLAVSIFMLVKLPAFVATVKEGSRGARYPALEWYPWLETVRLVVIATVVPLWVATNFFIQGRAFFDPRIANTLKS